MRDHLLVFALIFTCLFVTHAPLLRLPYFWDEAGYFIPAARDLLLTGSLIPHTTLSNAHPPLVMLWLAFWWKFSAFTPAVTRIAMLLVATFALTGVWRLARFVANDAVAAATVITTAVYSVFFTQSSMAHLDMMAAALTIWGVAMYVERRPVATVIFFALAPIAKETAIITPMALLGWELLCPLISRSSRLELCFQRRNLARTFSLLLGWLPLAVWLGYHRHQTGYFFGNPEYLRYNLGATVTPLRILLAMLIRVWHLFGYLNLFILTLLTLYAMSKPALLERDGSDRRRIAIPVQMVFAVVIAAYAVALSVLGGAVLARYMLPVLPLFILLCVSTLRRRLRHWVWGLAGVSAAFVFALFAAPPYRVAPEDTLLYRDYILLHKQAETEIARQHSKARVLTAWPASDEMTRPFLGYLSKPLNVVRIENFSEAELQRAAQATDQFDLAFLFTTKWQPPRPLWTTLPFGEVIQKRFFDYHEDVTPERAASLLGGRVILYENRDNEWVAVVAVERVENAALQRPF
ncbi:MAG TPA: glycosyltransferase [Candidatus Bathyarchaeia archaeon]|nr:glycosyltransferase [Candidatus Bathyarchaeia archaeon]